jgi:hypothetical protein
MTRRRARSVDCAPVWRAARTARSVPQSAPKRAPHAFVERDGHHLGGVGVAEVAAEADEIALVDLPHHAVAIRTGQHRPPAKTIHFAHGPRSASCDLDFVAQARGNARAPHRSADEPGCPASLGRSFSRTTWSGWTWLSAFIGMSGNAASLGSCTTAIPPQCRIAHSPELPSPSVPVNTTPIARGPQHTAAERSIGSIAGRYCSRAAPFPATACRPPRSDADRAGRCRYATCAAFRPVRRTSPGVPQPGSATRPGDGKCSDR